MIEYPNFSERAVPGVSANFLMAEALSRYNYASRLIKDNDRVLDMACGSGYGTKSISSFASQIIGIDISDEALELASRDYCQKASFLKMDVNKTIFKDQSFGVVIAFEMIEHLKNPKLFLRESKRLLKKNGVFIVSTPNRLIQSPNGILMSPYHTKEYSPTELKTLLLTSFHKVSLIGQNKNKIAKEALADFMISQKVRQLLVDIDVINIRKLISKKRKENLWKKLGAPFGRETQEKITTEDFIFSKSKIDESEYIIAICKK